MTDREKLEELIRRIRAFAQAVTKLNGTVSVQTVAMGLKVLLEGCEP